MVSYTDMTPEYRITIRRRKQPVRLATANGLLMANREAEINVVELGNETMTALVLDHPPAVIFLGRVCRKNGFYYH